MKEKVEQLRQEVFRVALKNKKGHIAPSLSCLDMLVALNYEPEFKNDTVILSKAHGCYGLYCIEADKGIISHEDWENFNLPGCYGELGSLGHGLPIGVGLAFGRKLQNLPGHVFVICGDGEMQEGSQWEAISFMAHHGLDNITLIIDNNGLQAIDKVENVLAHNLVKRISAFGLCVCTCNGHFYPDLLDTLLLRPQVVVAHTIKGKGYPAMEGKACFHYRLPTETESVYGG
jgi:transketolase